ncbi:MAG: type I-B CRISPR-associated protein Cas5b [Thermosediminibacteraceae bacterium]|nr:type I-B CRISPR-associated protein Cas5b [Thermosediminibacteraceae bacterium]
MISAVRIVIIAYTASFRVPNFVAHQLTLSVPPLSTIYGLLSAAAGQWVLPGNVEWLAYRCDYEGKAMDLEAIMTVERSKPDNPAKIVGRNVIEREFLVMPRLTLYLPPKWEDYFRKPRYPLLLGRTQDVASVESITPVTLEPVEEGEVSGVLLPLELVMNNRNRVDAWLQNLPIAFTAEPERRLLGVKIFGVVDSRREPAFVQTSGWLVRDSLDKTVVPIYKREWVTQAIMK